MSALPLASAEHARARRFMRLAAPVENTLEIQRSVFLTRLVPVTDEASAREIIDGARRVHHDARHHCSAFVLGADRDVQRSSDDGEPGGTAGVPMMQALLQRETGPGRRDLTDVVAVVTRWFGGILLGAGGLVRAYSDSVSSALDVATTLEYTRRRRLEVSVPMALAGRAEFVLRATDHPVVETRYGERGLTVTLAVVDDDATLDAAEAEVARLLGGEADSVRGTAVWAA